MCPPQASSWECFTGWWLKTGIIIPWETGIIQLFLLREAAAQVLSEEQAGTNVMEVVSALRPCRRPLHHKREGLHVPWTKELKRALKQAQQHQRVVKIQVYPYAYHVLIICSVLNPA